MPVLQVATGDRASSPFRPSSGCRAARAGALLITGTLVARTRAQAISRPRGRGSSRTRSPTRTAPSMTPLIAWRATIGGSATSGRVRRSCRSVVHSASKARKPATAAASRVRARAMGSKPLVGLGAATVRKRAREPTSATAPQPRAGKGAACRSSPTPRRRRGCW